MFFTILRVATVLSMLFVFDTGHARLAPNGAGYDGLAVAFEAMHAINLSDNPNNIGYSRENHRIFGNSVSEVNYLIDDRSRYEDLKRLYGCSASYWTTEKDGAIGCDNHGSRVSFFSDVDLYGLNAVDSLFGSVGRGGSSKFFANLIVWRSGVYEKKFPETSDMIKNSIGFGRTDVRVGDILMYASRCDVNGWHFAVVVKILKKGVDGMTMDGADVIDSDSCLLSDQQEGTPHREVILRHGIPNDRLHEAGAVIWKSPWREK